MFGFHPARPLVRGALLSCALLSSVTALTQAVAPVAKAVDPFDGKWHFSVTPYLWLPNVNGTTSYDLPSGPGQGVDSQVGPNDYLSALEFVLMVTGEARKGPWGVSTDLVYVDFKNQKSRVKTISGPIGIVQDPINLDTRSSLSGGAWTLAGFYTPAFSSKWHVDLLAGVRVLDLKTSLDWNLAGSLGGLASVGSTSRSITHWDGIIGAKGQARFGASPWFLTYYADLGAGSENWTWQAALGAGYRFHWGSILLVGRNISYEFDKGASVRFTGPAVAASWTF